MKQIRNKTFETNSSSTHSICISKRSEDIDMGLIEVDRFDDYVHTTFDQFGWERQTYHMADSKLSYLITFLAEKCWDKGVEIWCTSHPLDTDKIYDIFNEREDFRELNKIIKDTFQCNGIWIDDSSGYIDHQSHEDYSTIYELLNDWGVDSIEDFLFNSNIYIQTDNDNY